MLLRFVCVHMYVYIYIRTVCNYCNIQVVLLLYYYYILYYILFALLVTKAKLQTLLNLLSTSVYIHIPLTR